MATYRLSPRAKSDLLEIAKYTQQEWGQTQAKNYVKGLEVLCRVLAGSPGMARSCDEVRPGLRRLEHESHIVFLFPSDAGILISRILHKSRDVRHDQFE